LKKSLDGAGGLLMKYGLIGEKLGHSFSPEIHRVIFELSGIEGEYGLIELKKDEIEDFLGNAVKQEYKGVNVTIPYKTTVIPFMNQVSDEAKKIGAVNTIKVGDVLKGFNTDYFGIEYTFLKNGINVTGKTVLVAGSGGSSKSVVAYLLDKGVRKIYIASRNPGQVAKVHEAIEPVSYEDVSWFVPFDIVINTTPVGMYPNTGFSPLKTMHIKGAAFLFDLIYNPGKTELLKLADNLGIQNVNGLYMLVAQAVKAQEIWNEVKFGNDFIDSVYNSVVKLR